MVFVHLFLANVKLLYRNRQALFWALAFPLIFLVVFGLFRFDEPENVDIAVVDRAQDAVSGGLVEKMREVELLHVVTSLDEDQARQWLADGNAEAVLVIPAGLAGQVAQGQSVTMTLLYDQTRLQTSQVVIQVVAQFLGEANLAVQGGRHLLTLAPEGVQGKQLGYFDFLLPGLVGMGVMTFALNGMASQLALYRQQRILKRIKATPLPVRTFFLAQVCAWLVLSLVQTAIILAAGRLLFDAHIYGNVLWAFPLVVLANLTFLNLGFIVGSVARTVEAANGLANAVFVPMMFFSGVFFPTDSLPAVMRAVVRYLPLTPLLEAMRGVLLQAHAPWDHPWELGLLALWVVVTSVVAVRVFRFE